MELKTFIEHVAKQVKEDEFVEVCDRYGVEMVKIYDQFKKGNEEAATMFLRHWLPWLMGNMIISSDDLASLEVSAKQDLHILDLDTVPADGVWRKREGRWILLNGEVRSMDSARIYAYGGVVRVHDQGCVYAYNNTKVYGRSGWIYAFNSAEVYFKGRGIIESYDSAVVDAGGEVLVIPHDRSKVTLSSEGFLLDKRGGTFDRPDTFE